MSIATLKIKLSTGEVRRVGVNYFGSVLKAEDYNGFLTKVAELFNVPVGVFDRIQYTDADGDLVTVSSFLELAEALRSPASTLSLTVLVKEGHKGYTKNAAETQPTERQQSPTQVDPFSTFLSSVINARTANPTPGLPMGGGCGFNPFQMFSMMSGLTQMNKNKPQQEPQQGDVATLLQQFGAHFQSASQDPELVGFMQVIKGSVLEGKVPVSFLLGQDKGDNVDVSTIVGYAQQHPDSIEKMEPVLASTMKGLSIIPVTSVEPCELVSNHMLKLMSIAANEINEPSRKTLHRLALVVGKAGTEVFPRHSTLYYNTACAQALLGNTPAALNSLGLAIQHGYDDSQHLRTDPDLQSLHGLDAFVELVRTCELITELTTENTPKTATTTTSKHEDEIAEPQSGESGVPESLDDEDDEDMEIVEDVPENPKIQQLKSMGFNVPTEELASLLEKQGGNVAAVIALLV